MAAIKYKVLAESESRLNEVAHRGKLHHCAGVAPASRRCDSRWAFDQRRYRCQSAEAEEGLEAATAGPGAQVGRQAGSPWLPCPALRPPEGHVSPPSAGGQGGGAHLPGGAQILKKTNSSHGRKGNGASPSSGEFVARMEDVLDLYHEEYDRERPVVCFDESSKQLLGDVRPPIGLPPDGWSAMTLSTSETGPGTCSCSVNRRVGGGTSR